MVEEPSDLQCLMLHRLPGPGVRSERIYLSQRDYDIQQAKRDAAFRDFKDKPMIFNTLTRWFDSRDEVARYPDRELGAIRNIGAKSLAIIRQRIPSVGGHRPDCAHSGEWVYCPWCGVPL